MSKFFRVLLFNLKVETKFKVDYFVRLIMFFFRIIVFNELWDYLLKDKMILGYDRISLIWYITIGEAIIYTMSRNYIKISEMVKTGDIANILVKPINLLEYLFLMEFTSIINLILNMSLAMIFGIIILGVPHLSLFNLILFILSIVISYLMILSVQILIGILAFFFEENEPFYLVISKAILVVTMTPLEFFDGFMHKFMAILPTTYIIYTPGKIFLNCNLNTSVSLLLIQLLSAIFIIGLLMVLTMKGVKKVNVNGG